MNSSLHFVQKVISYLKNNSLDLGSLSNDSNKFDMKQAVELAFRTYILSCPQKDIKKIIDSAISAVQEDRANPSLPILLFGDFFGTHTLEDCEKMFSVLEDYSEIWKSQVFYSIIKNLLLRCCNDLFKRVSKIHKTVFCGRIQLFLAHLYPLAEKSGLNLMSNFNVDNITRFNKDSLDFDNCHAPNSGKDNGVLIDFHFYRRFWTLQDFFSNPLLCFDRNNSSAAWKTFTTCASELLNAFISFKLETNGHSSLSNFEFPKYLTNEKLLDLQLSDPIFRRNVLLQFLIIFQYMVDPVKFRIDALSQDQINWINNAKPQIHQLIRETPPNGENFTDAVIHLMNRETTVWNTWKNEGCPNFMLLPLDKEPKSMQRTHRTLGEDMRICDTANIVKLGNSELSRLWDCQDNLTACRRPMEGVSFKEFFQEAVEQIDPSAQIDSEYLIYKNPTWAWRALRLLRIRRSPYPCSQNARTVSEYLHSVLDRMRKDFDYFPGETDDSESPNTIGEKSSTVSTVSLEIIEKLGSLLNDDQWPSLAVELGFECPPVENASQFLLAWKNKRGDDATVSTLRQALSSIGLSNLCEDVFNSNP